MRTRTAPIRRSAVAAVLCTAVTVAGLAMPAQVGAAGDGSATSRVTRDGRIITSIVNRTPIRYSGKGTAPSTYWLTLSDAELQFVLALAAADPTLDNMFTAVLDAMSDSGAEAFSDIQIRITRGSWDGTARAVPTDRNAAPQVLARRMVTHLPPLRATVSPPPAAPAIIGEPVFTSFDAERWSTTVDQTLSSGGVTARVRAHPVSFTVRSGDPTDSRAVTCKGRGLPFNPDDQASPARQARRPGACAVTYRTTTGVKGRRDRWYGDLTVVWRAEWTTDGTTWRSLGDIPQISVFSRSVRPATTAIEAPS